MHQTKFMGPMALLVALSAGCGDGYDPSSEDASRTCVTISGDSTQVTTNTALWCSDCAVINSAHAIDANMDSVATARFNESGTGTMTIRATAQSGIVFPAGSSAGVILSLPGQSESSPYVGSFIDTYLNGVKQDRISETPGFIESVSMGTFGTGCKNPCSYRDRRPFGGTAPKPFDALEIGLARDVSGVRQDILVHEFCSQF